MPDEQRPRSFEEAVLADLRDPPVIAFSTGDSPGQRSIYDGAAVMDNIAEMNWLLDGLPPMIERITVRPDELTDFLARFPRAELPQQCISGSLGSLLSIPISTDPGIPANTVRLRRGGEERDYPLRPKAWMWPKGYEQPDAARLVSRDPDIYRSQPLRRIPWWRKWLRVR